MRRWWREREAIGRWILLMLVSTANWLRNSNKTIVLRMRRRNRVIHMRRLFKKLMKRHFSIKQANEFVLLWFFHILISKLKHTLLSLKQARQKRGRKRLNLQREKVYHDFIIVNKCIDKKFNPSELYLLIISVEYWTRETKILLISAKLELIEEKILVLSLVVFKEQLSKFDKEVYNKILQKAGMSNNIASGLEGLLFKRFQNGGSCCRWRLRFESS